ncbi:stage VI sporulation protein F [Bacillus taeanensis]|uniref:Stage VI sporulation protein F n=1 Tax=Bacillus taeanensis TaxID=273032 RepID=A0A366XRA7_9BACI|nr:stage VI sporulation protein F [Bacillus taeanensis]RBW68427.1 stage VI sporulation protein F [Bacillus taeanensis]
MSGNSFFGMIEKKTGVKMMEVLKLANSLKNANFKDEQTVRGVIKQVSKLANRPVPKEKEDQIVKAILTNNMPTDFASLIKMMNKK